MTDNTSRPLASRATQISAIFYHHRTFNESAVLADILNSSEIELYQQEHFQSQKVFEGDAREVRLSCQHRRIYSEPIASLTPDKVCPRHYLCASSLAVGESISLMGSFAEFSCYTKSHMMPPLSLEEACATWGRACAVLLRYVLQDAPRHFRVGSIGTCAVSGAYLHRRGERSFVFGLVTQSSPATPDTEKVLEVFEHATGKTFEERGVMLPIGSGLREVKLSMWWTPVDTRITPHTTIPPIRVILSKPHSVCKAIHLFQGHPAETVPVLAPKGKRRAGAAKLPDDRDRALFRGYTAVEVFLHRPTFSHIDGTSKRPVQHTSVQEIRDVFLTNDRTGSLSLTHCTSSFSTSSPEQKCTETVNLADAVNGAPIALQRCLPCQGLLRIEGDKIKQEVFFTDLSMGHTGEHFIMVEAVVEDAYKPFVPSLSAYLQPFLVV